MPKPHSVLSRRWLLIAAIALLVIAAFAGWYNRLKNPATQVPTKPPAPTWQATQLQAGDSVARVFQKYKIPAATLQEILKLKSAQKNLPHLRQGDEVAIKRDTAGNLLALRIPLNKKEWLVINRFKAQFASSRIARPHHIHYKQARGTVTTSLSHAFSKQKLPTSLLIQFEQIFSWEVNFRRDVHPGAHFALRYEVQTIDHRKQKPGNIVAATFNTGRRTIKAIRFTEKNGTTSYYTPQGKNLSGQFLRAPVHYRRISSPFNLRRWHPVLQEYRPHFGVDFAAPVGTPVVAAANGTITRHGRSKSYGNIIYIRHNIKYSTRYAHLEKFAGRLKVGSHVKKGQIIGYLGRTGLASGPNLHYEIRTFGVPRNPLTVKLPRDKPVNRSQLPRFIALAQKQLALLNQNTKQIAQTSP